MKVYNIEGKVIQESNTNVPILLIDLKEGWPTDLRGGKALWGGGLSPSYFSRLGAIFMPLSMLKKGTSFYISPFLGSHYDPSYFGSNTHMYYGTIKKIKNEINNCEGFFVGFQINERERISSEMLCDMLLRKNRAEEDLKLAYKFGGASNIIRHTKLKQNIPFIAPLFFPEHRVELNSDAVHNYADYFRFYHEWKNISSQ